MVKIDRSPPLIFFYSSTNERVCVFFSQPKEGQQPPSPSPPLPSTPKSLHSVFFFCLLRTDRQTDRQTGMAGFFFPGISGFFLVGKGITVLRNHGTFVCVWNLDVSVSDLAKIELLWGRVHRFSFALGNYMICMQCSRPSSSSSSFSTSSTITLSFAFPASLPPSLKLFHLP